MYTELEFSKLIALSKSQEKSDQLEFFNNFPIFVKKSQTDIDILERLSNMFDLKVLVDQWNELCSEMLNIAPNSGISYEKIIDHSTSINDFKEKFMDACIENVKLMQQQQSIEDLAQTEKIIFNTIIEQSKKELKNAFDSLHKSRPDTAEDQHQDVNPLGPAVYYTFKDYHKFLFVELSKEQPTSSVAEPAEQKDIFPHTPSSEEPRMEALGINTKK